MCLHSRRLPLPVGGAVVEDALPGLVLRGEVPVDRHVVRARLVPDLVDLAPRRVRKSENESEHASALSALFLSFSRNALRALDGAEAPELQLRRAAAVPKETI